MESLLFPVFGTKLKVFRVRNINRIIIRHININSVRYKIGLLAQGVSQISQNKQRRRCTCIYKRTHFLLAAQNALYS